MLPLIEQFAADQVPAIKQAVSQVQLAYVRAGGSQPPAETEAAAAPAAATPPTPPPAPEPDPIKPGQPGPAQRSGKLWVPGQ
jgi:hypothetical protein